MMAKVREALFNYFDYISLFQTNTTRVLDLFSGSGSIGLEALSRGASHATFVDFSKECLSTSLANSEYLGFTSRVSGVCAKVEEVLIHPTTFGLTQSYQLITLTPPYEEVDYNALLNALCQSPLVAEDTMIVIEYPIEMTALPHLVNDKLVGIRNRKYGRTVLAIYVFLPTKKYDIRPEEFINFKKPKKLISRT
jgi:16S rRNA (guanine(966)-N(2))-methyltransferase RsmD